MNLRFVEAFYWVVSLKSVSRAAEKLFITQSAMSSRLSVLYAVPWPPQGLYATRPVADTTDLAGRRMRTYNPTTQRIAEWVGAEGVEVPMIEVGRALAEGRIDCMVTSAVTGVENEVWSHVRYYYPINAWFPKNIVFVNTQVLQKLSREACEALVNAAASAETRGGAASEAAAQSSVETLRRNGTRIEPAPRQLVNSLKRLGERFSVDWIRRVGAGANEILCPVFRPVLKPWPRRRSATQPIFHNRARAVR
jgi:TRAP-type transport system periplasmic protein